MNQELINKIFSLADEYSNLTAQNLSRLVRIKSLSGKEEELSKEIQEQFREAGIDEIKTDGLGNIIARMGSGNRVLAFDGHMDTVDAGQLKNWEFDPFAGQTDEGYVLGRGSVDQKGALASLVTTAKILNDVGLPDDITLLFTATVMEEDCDGLCWKYMIEEDNIKPDAVVITEPTNLSISRGQRGRMEILVEFTGISSHGSAPERGKNAIYMASDISLKIKELNHNLKEHNFLGKGSVAVTEIKSESPALCAVPDYCSIYLDRRLTGGETKEEALRQIKELLKGTNADISVPFYEGKAYTGKVYGMDKYYPTWIMPEDHQLIRKAKEVYKSLFKEEPTIGKWLFSTNAISIKGMYDIPVIGFGPGDEAMAHSPNEKISITDLVKASAFYALFGIDFVNH